MSVLRSLTPLVPVLLLVACAAPGEPEGSEVRGPRAIVGWSNGGDVQIVSIDTCHGDPVAEVVETEATVTITVTSTKQDPGDACLDNLKVELDSDLGDRKLIDGVTGEEPPGIEG